MLRETVERSSLIERALELLHYFLLRVGACAAGCVQRVAEPRPRRHPRLTDVNLHVFPRSASWQDLHRLQLHQRALRQTARVGGYYG